MTPTLKKRIATGVLCATAAAVLTTGLYIWWLSTPPAMPTTAEQARAVLSSARFRHLPADRQLEYAHHIRQLLGEATAEERTAFFQGIQTDPDLQKVMRDMQRHALVSRARQYALADEAGRQQIMQELFVEFMQMRLLMQQQRAATQGGEPLTDEQRAAQREERRNEMVNEMESAAATGNPQDMQLVGEFMQELRRQMRNFPGRGSR